MFNIKEKLVGFKNKVRMAMVPLMGGSVAVGATVMSFASEPGGSSLPSMAITEEMLTPLVDGVVANVGVILPVGIGLFAIFLGIRLIPKLISKFARV